MKFYDTFASGVTHILQNRLRSGLSILGILIGIASVLCMMAVGDGAKKIVADDIKKLGGSNQIQFWARSTIWRRGRLMHYIREWYTLNDARAIEAECPNVIGVLPRIQEYETFANCNGREARPILEGITPDYEHLMPWNVQEGRFISENDIDDAAQVCVLGADVATALFENTSPLGKEVKIRYMLRHTPVRMRVVGILAPRGRSLKAYWWSLDNVICVPLTTYQQRFLGNRYVQTLIVFFHKDTNILSVIEDVKAVLRKHHRGINDFIRYSVPEARISELDRIEKIIKIALGGIAGFSLLVSGISIMNICLVSVGERTREIGLRKSVGAKRIDIFWQFLIESIGICLCGGFLGIVFGWLAAHGMARLTVRIVPIVEVWPVVLSVPWIVVSVVFSIFMGITFGVYPAIRAALMPPIDALRTDT